LSNWKQKAEEKRKERNKEIAEDLRNGTFIEPPINREMSWFPPRPIIQKDKRLVNQLHGRIKLVDTSQEGAS